MPTTTTYVRKHYGFEQAGSRRRAALYDEDDYYYDRFFSNLGLAGKRLHWTAIAELKRYVKVVHINADWYNRRVEREIFVQWVFLAVSFGLLVAIPVVVFKIGSGDAGGQAATLLTGLYGLHRAVYGWMKRRGLVVPYWSARSRLLNEIYTLETEWYASDEKVDGEGRLGKGFAQAIRESAASSREIVQKAEEKYFATYELPDFSLADDLKKAGTAAKETVTTFESRSARKLRERQQAEDELVQKIWTAELRLVELGAKREALQKEQGRKDIGEKDKKELETELEKIRKEQVVEIGKVAGLKAKAKAGGGARPAEQARPCVR